LFLLAGADPGAYDLYEFHVEGALTMAMTSGLAWI
jgi:hypothetical protein